MSGNKNARDSMGAESVDRLPIAVRAFATRPAEPDAKPPQRRRRTGRPMPPSTWTLVFDTETTIDPAQRLRVGAYQFRNGEALDEAGFFYDPGALSEAEIGLVARIAASKGVKLRTLAEFAEEVVYSRAYDVRASIVGFNLPFDISRLATGHGAARGETMRGGFTFRLSSDRFRPSIQIRHLNARAALIQFTHPPKRRDPRGQRKREIAPRERRGSFVDLKTIAAALFSRSFSLASLARFLKTPTQKAESGGHGKALTAKYLSYLVTDVQATWECYQALCAKFALHALEETPIGKVLSEASLGKAYLRDMGVRPFREVQPDFPVELTGKIMGAYYGGRAEVRWRRAIKQVLYCDFLSMYPTVCTLMGLWGFVIAQGVNWTDATEEVRALVDCVTIEDLQRPKFWPRLTAIVRIQPQRDIFPIRAKYDGKSPTIGLNFLSSDQPLWFTLADVVAAKLLTGKSPEIVEAIRFSPKEPQAGLKPKSIAGEAGFRVDPLTDDFFKRVTDLRGKVKRQLKGAAESEREALDAKQLALKILANSTSYGIYVEMNVAELEAAQRLSCYGPSGAGFSVESRKIEEPGPYFHPLVAALITGAARLMLAAAEYLCDRAGLDWAFCDTDSLAIAKPDEMPGTEFLRRAKLICDWFAPLNPYETKGPIFKIEDANYRISGNGVGGELEPLYCWCISAKRYALFNLDENGAPIIRKATAHGLGHLLPPYGGDDAPKSISAPVAKLSDIGVERWQFDLWWTIIRAVLDGHPDQVELNYHPALNMPAASRYAATTPALLNWFKSANANIDYSRRVRPFNFLLSFQARPQFELPDDDQLVIRRRGRPRKHGALRPIAPFNASPAIAANSAFDRETGKSVQAQSLMTYAEALAQYHLRPEAKFLNADFLDQGRTERRHAIATEIVHIGKEANRWEERYFLGDDDDTEIEYVSIHNAEDLDERILELCGQMGERKAAEALGISRTALRRALKQGLEAMLRRIRRGISDLL